MTMARSRKYRDEAWLRERLRDHWSRREIADECDVREETIAEWIDRFDIRLYRDEGWLRERVENYWTTSQIAADCAVTERTVERWLDEFDVERPDPPTVDDMEEHLERRFDDPEAVEKQERITALLGKYGELASKQRIVEAVGCSPDYASRFRWTDQERQVRQRHTRARESDSIHDQLRERVLKRDDAECVRCGVSDGEELVIHHVIPGESTEENLATLCRECHLDVHDGAFGEGVAYESRDEFWEQWARSTE